MIYISAPRLRRRAILRAVSGWGHCSGRDRPLCGPCTSVSRCRIGLCTPACFRDDPARSLRPQVPARCRLVAGKRHSDRPRLALVVGAWPSPRIAAFRPGPGLGLIVVLACGISSPLPIGRSICVFSSGGYWTCLRPFKRTSGHPGALAMHCTPRRTSRQRNTCEPILPDRVAKC